MAAYASSDVDTLLVVDLLGMGTGVT